MEYLLKGAIFYILRGMNDQVKKLRRSRTDRVFAGILGGFAKYFEVDSVLLRVLFILFVLVTGIFPGIIGYILAILVMPLENGRVVHEMPPEESSEKSESQESDTLR